MQEKGLRHFSGESTPAMGLSRGMSARQQRGWRRKRAWIAASLWYAISLITLLSLGAGTAVCFAIGGTALFHFSSDRSKPLADCVLLGFLYSAVPFAALGSNDFGILELPDGAWPAVWCTGIMSGVGALALIGREPRHPSEEAFSPDNVKFTVIFSIILTVFSVVLLALTRFLESMGGAS